MTLFVTAFGWENCMNYALSYDDNKNTINIEERNQYLTKLCAAVRACHANPQLYSYNVYVHDIVRCYELRLYNFDKSILEKHKPTIEHYIKTIQKKSRAEIYYDTLNFKAKDHMQSVVNIIRIRDAYLREYQYSSNPLLVGDILFLLKSTKQTFELDTHKQRNAIQTMSTTTQEQINSTQKIQRDIIHAQQDIEQLSLSVHEQRKIFDDFVVKIQENVIGSLMELEND
tara:strand:- start:4923 stop:5606 length:684 start_codon:yes stop_codon:yes gene_type:complete